MKVFFKYENQPTPDSLNYSGKLHTCQNSQLNEILRAQVKLPDMDPKGEVIIVDGSALINAIHPRGSKTFDNYVREDILPKVNSNRVFDVYKKSSLKSEARGKRRQGIRRRLTGTSKTPANWRSFLRNENNKNELFHFVAEKLCEAETTNTVTVTKEEHAISNKMMLMDAVASCSREEADTGMFVHARDATQCGCKSLITEANDTAVVVIAVSILPSLQQLGLQNMWIAFGQGAKA